MTCKEKLNEIEKILNDEHVIKIGCIREIVESAEDKSIPLDKVKQAREKIKKAIGVPICGEYIRRGHDMGLREALEIIDKLIKEVEE